MSKYHYKGQVMSAGEIRAASPEIQQGVMREWFYENFEDPANETPRIDGEYFFIYGGPHEPDYVLQEEFIDIVPEKVILSLVDDIVGEGGYEWAPTSSGIYIEQGFTDNPYVNFEEDLDNIRNLLSTEVRNVHGNVCKLFNMLLYASVITALEVYLADTLRQQIEMKDELTHDLETNQKFKEQPSLMPDDKEMDNIKKIINDEQRKFVWHRLKKVEGMYERALHITFPKNKAAILQAIQIRHSILHNGGRSQKRDGAVTLDGVTKLIHEVKVFVRDIERQIRQSNNPMAENESPEESPLF